MTHVFSQPLKKNKNKKKGKDEKYGSELTTPENSSSPGMMDMHGGWGEALGVGTTLLLGSFKLQQASRLSADDNSNQSSIADSSPVKQENSCSTSPTPDPTAAPHRERSDVKADQSPDSKRGEPHLSAMSEMVPSESASRWYRSSSAHQMDVGSTSCFCRHNLFPPPLRQNNRTCDKTEAAPS